MSERWLPIPGAPDYEVSDAGRVRSFRSWRGDRGPRVLSTHPNTDGYLEVRLATTGRLISARIHRLVMEAFVGPLPEAGVTRHLNGDKTDNELANLAYGTPAENMADQLAHGHHRGAAQTECRRGHPLAGENLVRKPNGGRKCRECGRLKAQRHNWKRRGIPARMGKAS